MKLIYLSYLSYLQYPNPHKFYSVIVIFTISKFSTIPSCFDSVIGLSNNGNNVKYFAPQNPFSEDLSL